MDKFQDVKIRLLQGDGTSSDAQKTFNVEIKVVDQMTLLKATAGISCCIKLNFTMCYLNSNVNYQISSSYNFCFHYSGRVSYTNQGLLLLKN